MPSTRSSHFAWTLFDYEPYLDSLRSVAIEGSDYNVPWVSYICFGFEVCPTTGRLHLQGYIQCSGRKRFSQIQSAIGTTKLHIEECLGSDEENVTYCSKDESFEEYGTRRPMKGIGKENRAIEEFGDILTMIKDGGSLRDISEMFPMHFIKYHHGITRMHSMFQKLPLRIFHGPWKWCIEHDWDTSLHLWGASGIGKTQFSKSLLPRALFVSHLDQLKAYDSTVFDGIIFDDMSFLHVPREAQIHLVDVDEDRAIHVRYGCAHIPRSTKKIFLSNIPGIFLEDNAIRRRVTTIFLQ